jgi:hypothetical protein
MGKKDNSVFAQIEARAKQDCLIAGNNGNRRKVSN